nr:hypothetical protein [Tanacetum cinerariifolium]
MEESGADSGGGKRGLGSEQCPFKMGGKMTGVLFCNLTQLVPVVRQFSRQFSSVLFFLALLTEAALDFPGFTTLLVFV